MAGALTFPATANMLVGQPFKLQTWFVTILVRCTCQPENAAPLLIVGQPGSAMGSCPACGRRFALQGIQTAPDGQAVFQIGAEARPVAQS